MKIYKLFLFVVLALFFQISLISSQETQIFTETTDIGNLIGLEEGKIIGKGVEYQQLGENTKLSFIEENAQVEIGEEVFTNIVPQSDSKHPTYINLDEKGDIVNADFTVNEEGGTYVFGNTQINAPSNSRVLFDEESGIKIRASEGSELTEIPRSKDGLLSKYATIIQGDKIKLPGGNIISGRLGFNNGQAFLESGQELVLDDVKFLSVGNDVNLYFDKNFNPSLHENENYYLKVDDSFAMHSVSNGKVEVEYLAGNDFFEMTRRDYPEENGNLIPFQEGDEVEGYLKDGTGLKYKLVPDERDFLRLSSENGNQILARKAEAGKIPDLLHVNSENGKTIINNGAKKFILSDEIYYDLRYPTTEVEFEKIISDETQSVGFQLTSPSIPKDKELRFSRFDNQFAFLNPEEKDVRVVINPYGRPVSQYPEEIRRFTDSIFDPLKSDDWWAIDPDSVRVYSENVRLTESFGKSGEIIKPYTSGYRVFSHHENPIYEDYFSDIPSGQGGYKIFQLPLENPRFIKTVGSEVFLGRDLIRSYDEIHRTKIDYAGLDKVIVNIRNSVRPEGGGGAGVDLNIFQEIYNVKNFDTSEAAKRYFYDVLSYFDMAGEMKAWQYSSQGAFDKLKRIKAIQGIEGPDLKANVNELEADSFLN